MLKAIDDFSLGLKNIRKILSGDRDETAIGLLEQLNQKMEEARKCAKLKQYCQKKLCGTVFYIFESDYGTSEFHPRMFKVPNEVIDDTFMVLENMIDNHKSPAYKNAFDKMKYD